MKEKEGNKGVREYLTTDEVAEMLGVCRETILRWIRKGKLKAIKFRVFRIAKTDLEEFLEQLKYKEGLKKK